MAEMDATRACVVCGNALTSKMDKKCCGAECSAEHRRRWMADRWSKRKPEMSRLQCAHCSAEFLTSHAKQQKYCGSACRNMADSVREYGLSVCCAVCGVSFPRNGAVKLCSDECRHARNLQHQRESALRAGRIKGQQQLTCAHCKASFTGRADRAYCSGECKDAARRLSGAQAASNAKYSAANKDRISSYGRRYKAMRRATGGIDKTHDRVRKLRMKLVCGSLSAADIRAIKAERCDCLYCGLQLDHAAKVMDHMDPLSKGGAHDRSNIVVCCAKCNLSKSAKQFADWLLIVPATRRKMIARVYEMKRGATFEQPSLFGAMLAA